MADHQALRRDRALAMNPSGRAWLQGDEMRDLVMFVGFIGFWFLLQIWILPKLGVST